MSKVAGCWLELQPAISLWQVLWTAARGNSWSEEEPLYRSPNTSFVTLWLMNQHISTLLCSNQEHEMQMCLEMTLGPRKRGLKMVIYDPTWRQQYMHMDSGKPKWRQDSAVAQSILQSRRDIC